jgi:hypothetical protein
MERRMGEIPVRLFSFTLGFDPPAGSEVSHLGTPAGRRVYGPTTHIR